MTYSYMLLINKQFKVMMPFFNVADVDMILFWKRLDGIDNSWIPKLKKTQKT